MDFQSLTVQYANKTDDELLRLAAQSDQLTLEAQSALRSELGKRRIILERAVAETTPQPAQVNSERAKLPNAPLFSPVDEFIGEVFRLYRRHLGVFLKLTAPAVLIGTGAILTAHHEAREMIHHISWSSFNQTILFIEVSFLNLSGWAVSWIALSFAFACICVIVRQMTLSEDLSAAEACQAVISRLPSFVRVSLSLFLIFIALFGLAEMLTTAVVFRFLGPLLRYPLVSFAFSLCAYTAIALIVSRFALTVPAVVLDGFKVSESFFLSDELTEKKWMILAILLTKSILGGYIAAMMPFWIVGWLPIPENIQLSRWFSWSLTGASVATVSYVEPIMFIGFALLYEKTCGRTVFIDLQTSAASSG